MNLAESQTISSTFQSTGKDVLGSQKCHTAIITPKSSSAAAQPVRASAGAEATGISTSGKGSKVPEGDGEGTVQNMLRKCLPELLCYSLKLVTLDGLN